MLLQKLRKFSPINQYFYTPIKRTYSEESFSFAIVGSGPSGLFTAKKIYAEMENVNVHIFEKELVPSGLIRYGMAPDHERIKRVGNDLLHIAQYESCKFFGGVEIGKDISPEQLKQFYSAIIFAFGAQGEKHLGIQQENTIKGIYGGQDIVKWYNSFMDQELNIDLSKVRTLAVIGNGNVAIDICRVLGQPIDRISPTDINLKALDQIKKRGIQNMIIIGRRGLIQSAFTLKELREMSKIDTFEFFLYQPDLVLSLNENSIIETQDLGVNYGNTTRANRRKLEFLKNFTIINDEPTLKKLLDTKSEKIRVIFRFLLSPKNISNNDEEQIKIQFNRNNLTGEAFKQTVNVTDEEEEITCDMLIRSVGYQSINIDKNLAWDFKNNILYHSHGCLINKDNSDKIDVGSFVSGWAKTGPVGVIESTFESSIETLNNVRNQIETGSIKPKSDPSDYIFNLLRQKNVKYTTFKDWELIDQNELQKGSQQNKTRLKYLHKNEIYQLINKI